MKNKIMLFVLSIHLSNSILAEDYSYEEFKKHTCNSLNIKIRSIESLKKEELKAINLEAINSENIQSLKDEDIQSINKINNNHYSRMAEAIKEAINVVILKINNDSKRGTKFHPLWDYELVLGRYLSNVNDDREYLCQVYSDIIQSRKDEKERNNFYEKNRSKEIDLNQFE
jgi:hypothetical protein